ncbi:MAG: SLBB domain-containing protein, partial [Gemmatimonadota bacterium]
VELRQEIVKSLATAFEQARIEEVRNTPGATIVEPADLPVNPDSRRVALRGVLGLAFGGIIAFFWILARQFFERIREEEPDDYQRLVNLSRRTVGDLSAVFGRFRWRGGRGALVFLLAAAAFAVRAPTASLAQETERLRHRAEQALGRPISDAEILRRLRASGLTAEQVRRRLEAAGFERTAADPYLAVLAGASDAVPEGTDAMPLVELLVQAEAERSERRLGALPAGRPRPARAQPPPASGPPIFGRDLFQRGTSQFQPVTTGPVPPDYRLGPGDQVVLVLTGGVEQAYQLTVTREGWVVIPDVGRVFVNGLTLEDLREALFNRLSQAYSGIRRGPGATTFFDVSLGKLRTNQVFVIGEVEAPAAYNVSSLATALTALYWAGGPGVNGSFRDILVTRAGETHRIDLYDYLLRGDASQDLRLNQGDIVFVPPVRRRVAIDGAVMRPGLYELKADESLADLIRFAGGLQPNADLRRVQISRILPPAERSPGRDRAVVDVELASAAEGAGVPLVPGDRVSVFAVLDEMRNRVTISGGVWRPGTYGAEPGMRLWDLIERAGGLLPDAYEGRAQIQRLDERDYTRRMIPVNLQRAADGTPRENPEITGMDQVFVYARRNLREDRVVSIRGWVQEPGVYPYVDGMTLRDLILKAKGVRTGAFLDHAEVSRVVISQERTDTLTRRFQVRLDSSYVFNGGRPPRGTGAPESGEFVLRNLDAVYVRRAPGFAPQQNVLVSGEVLLPGPYSMETRSERLTDLVERAGGLTPDAYPEGLQLWRATAGTLVDTLSAPEIAGRAFGTELTAEERARLQAAGEIRERLRPAAVPVRRTRVGVDFVRAMRRPDGRENILVEPGDSIFVPRYIATVEVRGAVGVVTKVLYHEGAGLGYYIDQAGGYSDNADRSRTRVRYANGEVRTRGRKFLFFGGGVPDPDPGSVITVPVRPPRQPGGIRLTELVAILSSVMTAAATVIIAAQ